MVEQIKSIISKYKTSSQVEIQQRAVEYNQLHGLDRDTRIALLERVPVLESAIKEEDNKGRGSAAVLLLDSPIEVLNRKDKSASTAMVQH